MSHYCAVCPNKTENQCSSCKAVKFCSERCQQLVWKSHKWICGGNSLVLEQPEISDAEWKYLALKDGYDEDPAYMYLFFWKRQIGMPGTPTIAHYRDKDGTTPADTCRLKAKMYDYDTKPAPEDPFERQQRVQALRMIAWKVLRLQRFIPEAPPTFPILIYHLASYMECAKFIVLDTKASEVAKSGLPVESEEVVQKFWKDCQPALNELFRQALIHLTLHYEAANDPEVTALAELAGERVASELDKLRNESDSIIARALSKHEWFSTRLIE